MSSSVIHGMTVKQFNVKCFVARVFFERMLEFVVDDKGC